MGCRRYIFFTRCVKVYGDQRQLWHAVHSKSLKCLYDALSLAKQSKIIFPKKKKNPWCEGYSELKVIDKSNINYLIHVRKLVKISLHCSFTFLSLFSSKIHHFITVHQQCRLCRIWHHFHCVVCCLLYNMQLESELVQF